MSIKPLEFLDKVTTAVFALTIAFSFCGLFLVPSGQSILSNLLVASTILGLLNYFIGRKKAIFFTDRRLILVFVFYAVVILINRVIHGDQYGVMRDLFYVSVFSLLMPRKKILLSMGCVSISVGGIGLGLLSLWQYENGIVRVEGFTNSILFSQAALTLAILNWCLFIRARKTCWIKMGFLIGLTTSLLALYLSQSRGVWLALGAVIGILIIYKSLYKPLKYTFVALLLVALAGGIYQTNTIVQGRMAEAVSDMKGIEGGTYYSSWGLRVVAWESAWLGFLDSPLIGVGTDGFTVVKEQQIAQGLVSPLVMDPALAHAHSQYMQNLIIRGAVGILALVIFLFYPIKLITERAGWGSPYTMIPLSFAVSGLSDVPFEHQNTLYLYVLSLLFCWCVIEFNTEKKTS